MAYIESSSPQEVFASAPEDLTMRVEDLDGISRYRPIQIVTEPKDK